MLHIFQSFYISTKEVIDRNLVCITKSWKNKIKNICKKLLLNKYQMSWNHLNLKVFKLKTFIIVYDSIAERFFRTTGPYVLFIERLKKIALKKFGISIWCTNKIFGYRVVHHMLINILRAKQFFLSSKYLDN